MSYYLNEIRVIGTDSAAWFLFHPDDLVHRNEDPINWWSYDFAARREFTAGTLVGVETGSDGGFGVRLTNQELTEREKKYAVKSQSFRLRIRHDRLLIDGGYILPSEREYSVSVASDSPYWISVQNGDYRVTVYAIAWYDEPGAVDPGGVATENALTSYVAAFEAVEDLNSVNIPPSIPRLNPWDPEYTFSPNPEAKPVQESWEQEFAILVWSEIIFPGIPQELPLTRKQNRYVHRALHKEMRFSLVIASQPKAQAVATLFTIYCYGGYYGGSYKSMEQTDVFSLSGYGTQVVEITNIRENKGIIWASIKPLVRPSSEAGPTSVAELKQRFAKYAATSPNYRKRVPYAQFHVERVAALTKPLEVGWAIASALELPVDTKLHLLSAVEAELIQRLNEEMSKIDA